MHNSNEAFEDDASMSARIKEARQARGWSQQELAERVSVSQPTIVHWEQGTHIPRHLALARLADALGVSRQWLQGDGATVETAALPKTVFGQTTHLNQNHNYLSLPLHHVPIYAGPLDRTEIGASLRGERTPIGYIPAAMTLQSPLAMRVEDTAVRREFPKGSIAIIECGNKSLEDGKFYLFALNGTARLRRWGANPMRLEADSLEDVQFLASAPEVLGRVVMSVRSY
jgi:transcriptional regulator with XRE-family HTH domain